MEAVALDELMKDFNLPEFLVVHTHMVDGSETLRQRGDIVLTGVDREKFELLLNRAHELASGLGFAHAKAKTYALQVKLERGWPLTARDLATHLESLKDDFEFSMFSHEFVQVESDVKGYRGASALFGQDVISRFPSALSDIGDAGDCIAVDLNNACIFHLMHVVEWGIRALCKRVGLTDVVMDRKSGKSIPVEFSQWEKILQQLPDKVQAEIDAMPPGATKQHAQETFYSALAELRGFKDAWRNHVMHTRASYNRADAQAVWSHVERFMKKLASEGIGE